MGELTREKDHEDMNPAKVYSVGLLVHFIGVLYCELIDRIRISGVRFTDIDYFVFTDAAEYVTKGDSPYSRPTYRYTPLLAWLLTPNILLFNAFGKLVFVACDMLCGYLLFEIQRARSIPPSKSADSIFFAWMCNPLVLIISTRGSAESVVILFVLGSLYFLTKQGSLNLCIAGVLHGLSVHTKIYPVTFSLPIYLMLDRHYSGIEGRTLFGFDVLPNKSRVIFVVSAIVSFASATAFCYHWYGWEFLQETYLYHVTRRDTRHNFSVFFYMLYLTAEAQYSWIIGLIAFLPQATLILLSSWYFHRDLPFCCFVNTFVFVTFNKVCTAQYFMWYISFLPLIVGSLDERNRQMKPFMWINALITWLEPAGRLEFFGRQRFSEIWIASLLFFSTNCFILWQVVSCYRITPLFRNGHLEKLPSIQSSETPLTRRPLHGPETKKNQ